MNRHYTVVVPSPAQPKWAMPEHFINLFTWNGLGSSVTVTNDPGSLEAKLETRPIYALNLNNQYRLDKDLALTKASKNPFVYEAFDEAVWEEMLKRDGVLLLDSAVEALVSRDDIAAGLLRGIEKAGLEPRRVVVLDNNLRAHDQFESKYLSGLENRPKILDFDSCYWLMVGLNRLTDESRDRLESRARAAHDARKSREKKFISFNGRLRPHRFYILLWMFSNGLFKDGLISFLGYGQGDQPDWAKLKKQLPLYPEHESTIDSFDEFARMLPISLDVSLEDSQMSAAYKRTLPWRSQSSELYDQAYFSVVIDTEFKSEHLLFNTPIAFKSFMNFSPFVYFGNWGSLKRMRELGFKTFAPFVDESYDEVVDSTKRMQLALDQLRRLNSLSLASLNEMYNQLWPVLEHNYWHFHRDAPRQAADVIERELFRPIVEA